jgi:RNA polymerase sigma-70 factor, ECF subfamily
VICRLAFLDDLSTRVSRGNDTSRRGCDSKSQTMNATDTSDVESDVLVIGAGPTRLVLDVVDARSVLGHSTFDDMLALFKDEIYRYAVHLTRNHVEADDLYQRTLLDAYHAFEQLDGTTNYRTWLYSLATSAFLRDRRTRGREEPIDMEWADESPRTHGKHAPRLDARNLHAAVEAGFATLPPRQRAALVQRKFHNLGYAEIAASLGCSETAARDCVYTALRTLRSRCGNLLSDAQR